MKNNSFLKKPKGFSLIELSIVILIIGIIVASIIGGRKLVTLSNLSKARALTTSSPVAGIEDLTMWWEATSKSSFTTTTPTDGATISTWYDINPQQTVKYNLTAGDAPTYTANAINGLPAVNFNGSSNFLNFNGNPLIGTDFTIFAVEQRASSNIGIIICGVSNWVFGYDTNTTVSYRTNNPVNTTVPGYTTPTARIHSFTFTPSIGHIAFINGGSRTLSGTPASAYLTNTILPSNIGTYSSNFYTGYIGEIIIFSRVLSDFERTQIEQYLSKKWGIKLI
jgi:prepilin-type N-terminal cleavage/methylation domain-containing protein